MNIKTVWAVYFSGTGTTEKVATTLAKDLAERLGAGYDTYCFNLPQAREKELYFGPEDLVVLFSFSKLSREGHVLLNHSRAAGYRTLAFVGRTCLPAEERADISLFAYRGREKEYHSMAAPAALLDALAVAVAERLGFEGTNRLQALHQMKKDYFPDG